MFRALFKGWLGEKSTQLGMWLYLDEQVYRRFHDVIVPSRNGTTQIDHVVVSVYGIFVVETKNHSGWIFGDEHAAQWTAVHYGKKFSFQNPLRQNYRHMQCLAEYLRLPPDLIYSVVFFIGECEFKTTFPPNVMTEGLATYIKQFSRPLLTPEQAGAVVSALASLKANPSLTKARHLQSLEERLSSTTICPICGGALVQRVARKGTNAGNPFWGCSNFPRCRYTRPA